MILSGHPNRSVYLLICLLTVVLLLRHLVSNTVLTLVCLCLDAGISGSDSAVLLTSAQSWCDIRSITTSTFRQHHETFGLDLRNISVPKGVATDLPQIEDMSGYSIQIIKMLMSKMGMSEGVFLSRPFNFHPITGTTVDVLKASVVYNNYYIMFVHRSLRRLSKND